MMASRSRAEARFRVVEPAVLATPESAAGPAVSGGWTPRDPPAFDGRDGSEELPCLADSRRGDRRHRFSRPRRVVRRACAPPAPKGRLRCSAGPEGSASLHRAPPEGGVRRAAQRTEVRPLARARLPKEPRLQAKPRCQCLHGSNDAAGPKSSTRGRSCGLEPKLEAQAPKCLGREPAEAGRGQRAETRRVTVPASAEAPVPRAEARDRPSPGALRGALLARDPDLHRRLASQATGATSASSAEAESRGGPEDRTVVG